MINFEDIKNALLSENGSKVAISSGSVDIPIWGVSHSQNSLEIWASPRKGQAFKLTEDHTLKILS